FRVCALINRPLTPCTSTSPLLLEEPSSTRPAPESTRSIMFSSNLLYFANWLVSTSNFLSNSSKSSSSPYTLILLPLATIFSLGKYFLRSSIFSFCCPKNSWGLISVSSIISSFKQRGVLRLFMTNRNRSFLPNFTHKLNQNSIWAGKNISTAWHADHNLNH